MMYGVHMLIFPLAEANINIHSELVSAILQPFQLLAIKILLTRIEIILEFFHILVSFSLQFGDDANHIRLQIVLAYTPN